MFYAAYLVVIPQDTFSCDWALQMKQYMSLVVRKPAFCICENKDADQLRGSAPLFSLHG